MSLVRRTVTPLVVALVATTPFAQTLVRDIDATPAVETVGSDPADITFTDGLTFFTAVGPGMGRELYASDGTPSGSGVVIDLYPGQLSSEPHELTALGSDVFFVASDPEKFGVFKSDGTPEGTELFMSKADGLGVGGGKLYIRDRHAGISTIYVSDGTVAGTSTLYVGTTTDADLLGELNGSFLFLGDNDVIFRTDGTPGGTTVLADAVNLRDYSIAAGTLWFMDQVVPVGIPQLPPRWELWKSSGPGPGVVKVADLVELFPMDLTAGANGCIFSTNNASFSNREPWVSDGTGPGTVELADLSSSHGGSDPQDFTPFGDGWVFSADGPSGRELYITDGTTEGTQLVADINPGIHASNPADMTVLGNEILFRAASPVNNTELWKTDGTEAGTVLFAELFSDGGSFPDGLVSDGANVWFGGKADGVGDELFVTDGNTLTLLADLAPNPVSGSSTIAFVADLFGTAVFLADDGVNGTELWASRGTEATTWMLADIAPGGGLPGSIVLTSHAIFDELLYFIASTGAGSRLWSTDGTPGGTVEVLPGQDAFEAAVSNGKLYFAAEDPDREPWVLDGKLEQPRKLADLNPGSSLPGSFHAVGDVTVFAAEHPDRGRELFVTDGTEAGTEILTDLDPGPNGSFPDDFRRVGGELFFVADTGGIERIWSTDGTKDGTVLRHDPNLEFGLGNIVGVTASADALYYVGNQKPYAFEPATNQAVDFLFGDTVVGFDTFHRVGDELMILDSDRETLYGYTGTPGVFDVLATGPGLPTPLDVEVAGDRAFVQQDNELLITDGTLAGTMLAEELAPFSMSLYAYDETQLFPTAVGSDTRVVVQGYDDASGRELWVSDGTGAGTQLVADIAGGLGGSEPQQFFRSGDLVYFTADDGVHGRELHAVPFLSTGGWVAQPFGSVCPMTTGEEPRMASSGTAAIGDATFTVDYDGAPAGSSALLVYSPLQGTETLGGGCALYFGTPWFLYPGAALTDLDGHGTLPVPLPDDPALAGLALYFQYLVSDPGGALFGAVAPTDGLEVLLGP